MFTTNDMSLSWEITSDDQMTLIKVQLLHQVKKVGGGGGGGVKLWTMNTCRTHVSDTYCCFSCFFLKWENLEVLFCFNFAS